MTLCSTQRSCTRVCVHKTLDSWCWERCHLYWIGDKQKYTRSKCRVKDIFAKTSKWHLCHADSNYSTHNNNPKRNICRQVHCKQQSCYNSREVVYSYRTLYKVLLYQKLKQNAARNADSSNCKHIPTKHPYRNHQRREQCNHYVAHQANGRVVAMHMRRG